MTEIDYGQARLDEAHRRKQEAEAIIRRVAARHAVAVDALSGQHKARRLQHVVSARCHAAHELRQAGYDWKSIAKHLGMKGHSLAIWSANQWAERHPHRPAGGES